VPLAAARITPEFDDYRIGFTKNARGGAAVDSF
jgi:hypothetical protein